MDLAVNCIRARKIMKGSELAPMRTVYSLVVQGGGGGGILAPNKRKYAEDFGCISNI